MPLFSFIVRDEEGLWGSIQCHGRTSSVAMKACRRQLQKEVAPRGSLQRRFTLKLIGRR